MEKGAEGNVTPRNARGQKRKRATYSTADAEAQQGKFILH
jgi:hypothetical protein